MSAILERIESRTSKGSADVDHLFCCCSPSIALCGADIAGEAECTDCDHPNCESCDAIIEVPCVLCGFGVIGPCYCGGCNL